MKLSDRLQMIADEIEIGETMADVGTDHGFLPLFLLETGKCPRAIMTDISSDSLKKAEKNCMKLSNERKFDLRLGSGIEVLKHGEIDDVVIAGMGGILIRKILESDLEKSHSFKKIIIQPRNNIGKLRFWLEKNDFRITKENLVRENKFICEILTVENGRADDIREHYSFYHEFPHSLVEFKNPLSEEYLNRHLQKKKSIREKIVKNGKNMGNDLMLVDRQIETISELMKELRRSNGKA